MPWPARLVAIAATHRSAISSSVAPARSAPRRSDSSRANRQLRTWPSAVSRTRSQSPQNGRVTDAMTPTVAGTAVDQEQLGRRAPPRLDRPG